MLDFVMDLQRFAEDAGTESAGTDAGGTSIVGGAQAGGAQDAAIGGTDRTADVGGAQEASANATETSANAEEKTANTQEKAAESVPEAYDFHDAVPEGMEYDEASAKAFGALAKECGLTQTQASKLAAYGMEYMKNGVGAFQQAQMAQRAQWEKDAKTELGGDYDATVAKCGVAVDTLQQRVPGLREAMNETGAGNRVEVIRAMAVLGELIGEDRGHGAAGTPAKDAPIYGNTNFAQY